MPEKVSIVVPLYNRAGVVGETIQSVLDQTTPNWELIIVDDGSTDNSERVVNSYAAKDERIKLYKRHRDPKGAPTCRNIGMEKSTGEYVIFLDSDDLLAPFCIERRLEAFRRFPTSDFIVYNGLLFVEHPMDSVLIWNIEKIESDLLRFAHGDNPWQTTAPIWKTAALLNYRLNWDETAIDWQDWEFHIKALISGANYKKFLSDPDFYIRRSNDENHISSGEFSLKRVLMRISLLGRKKKEFKQGAPQATYDQLCEGIQRILFYYLDSFIFKKMNFKMLLREAKAANLISRYEYVVYSAYAHSLSLALKSKIPGFTGLVYSYRKVKFKPLGFRNTIFSCSTSGLDYAKFQPNINA